jgi:hypothetical protein
MKKQIRFKGFVKVFDRCFNCPLCHITHHTEDRLRGFWFYCAGGGSLPLRTPLMEIALPIDCPAEDAT